MDENDIKNNMLEVAMKTAEMLGMDDLSWEGVGLALINAEIVRYTLGHTTFKEHYRYVHLGKDALPEQLFVKYILTRENWKHKNTFKKFLEKEKQD